MSDISDVLVVLAKHAAAAIYPTLTWDTIDANWDSGELWDLATGQSLVGNDVRIYPGWPTSNRLDDDLAAGIAHVSIFPRPEERNTTRYSERSHTVEAAVTTLVLSSAVVAGKYVVTVSGTVSVPQNVALRINGKFYVYGVEQGDTLEDIATALADLVAEDIPDTSVSGTALPIGPAGRLQAARVGGVGTVAKELRRQERMIQIVIWAHDPAVRDAIAGAVDVELAGTRFLEMPDGFGARLTYKNSPVIDALQKAALYRRDLNYLVEYATTKSKQRAAVIAPYVNYENRTITF